MIAYFAWDLEKQKKVWHWNLVNWYSIKYGTFLWKNHAEKLHQKLVPDLFLILINNQEHPLHARNSFNNKRIIKRGQNLEQKGPGTSDQSLFRLHHKFRKFFLINDVLPDQVWCCTTEWFLSYSKNYIC